MKKLDELRTLSIAQLNTELVDLRKQQFNLRMKKANGSLDNKGLITLIRRSIARVKTLITEKAGMKDDNA